MALLDRTAILSNKTLRRQTVSVPEWGGEVIVRELMANEGDIYEAAFLHMRDNNNGKEKLDGMRAKIVAMACINEDGSQMFTEADVAELGKLSRVALDRVATAASRLSGYTKDSEDEIKKNSPSSESLNSGSQSLSASQ